MQRGVRQVRRVRSDELNREVFNVEFDVFTLFAACEVV